MPVRIEDRNESTWVLIAQLIALLIAYAVPVLILALIMPDRTTIIVMVSVYLLFGISALFAGIGWNEATYSAEAHTYTKWVLFFTVVAMAISRWTSYPDQEITDWLASVTLRGCILVLPFFVGRFISRQLDKLARPQPK